MLDRLIDDSLLTVGLEIKDVSGFLTNCWAAAVPKLLTIGGGILRL